MHMTIRELQRQNHTRRLTKQLLNYTLSPLLRCLSFLHDEANVVHAGKQSCILEKRTQPLTEVFQDINPSNIMLTIEDDSILHDFEKAEAEDPSPRKIIDDSRTIYSSRKLGLPKGDLWGRPVLCDFGEARIGGCHRGCIQPTRYRAPEVAFEMEWTSSADIWSVAALVRHAPSVAIQSLH